MVFTGVVTDGGWEDQLYAHHAASAGTIDGNPAVVSSFFGGNGALAWEPVPGVMAYVGYSGTTSLRDAVGDLRRLANRSHFLTSAQWQAAHQQTIDRVNDVG